MTKSIAIEGLPGAGKTTLLDLCRRRHPDVTTVGELVLPAPREPTRDFFVLNDRVKTAQVSARDCVITDRFWASTVSYVTAEKRVKREPATPGQVIAELYGRSLAVPSACIFLDHPRALEETNAPDGLFPNADFRRHLRLAYFELLAELDIPTLTLCRTNGNVGSFVAMHLDVRVINA
jgi:thymidylate kinase